MDVWQLGQVIVGLVAGVKWNDPPGTNSIFASGNVFASEDESGNFLKDPPGGLPEDGPVEFTPPFARVEHVGVRIDNSVTPPRIAEARFRVHVTAGSGGVAGVTAPTNTTLNDSHGINQVTGANRDTTTSFGQGQSSGRDVNEIVGRLEEALNYGSFVDSTHGFQGYVSDWGVFQPADGVQILTRAFEVVVTNASTSRTYHTARSFRATASGGGSIALSWVNPPATYDWIGNVLRRGTNPGDAAPSSPTTGTGISVTGGVQGTSATDAGHSASQVFYYALFEAYAETPASRASSTAERYSSSVRASVTVT